VTAKPRTPSIDHGRPGEPFQANVLRQLGNITRLLTTLLAAQTHLKDQETQIMADLTNLTAAVAAETTAEQSAITLLTTLAADLAAAKTDPAAIQAIADQMNTNAAALGAAVVANTPAG